MLNLPVYRLPQSGIWYFHTRFNGQQFKRSLGTRDKTLATLKAIELVKVMTHRKFEIDLQRGIFKAEPGADTEAMIEAIGVISRHSKNLTPPNPNPSPGKGTLEKESSVAAKGSKPKSTLKQLLDDFFLLKSHLTAATRTSYEGTINEFSQFLKNPDIGNIQTTHVTEFQKILAARGNTSRTIDSKVGTIRSLFNFAIKQGKVQGKNPAERLNLLTKKQKNSGGFGIFDRDEIIQIFDSAYFKEQKTKDPNYYWGTLLALISGCRSSEITSLKAGDIKTSETGVRYLAIRDSKTTAGIRDVPIPSTFFELGFAQFIEGKTDNIFKYENRVGKGAGNAIGKKFSRHLEIVKVKREKLVFHSLRKFCNNYLLENDVSMEARCQFIGHEIGSVNITTYTNKISVDALGKLVLTAQNKIIDMIMI
jgi:site-specific recombinase XerD